MTARTEIEGLTDMPKWPNAGRAKRMTVNEQLNFYIARSVALTPRYALAVRLLEEAIEDIESWGAYAGEYFQGKHGLQQTIAEYRAALPRLKEGL